MSNNESIYSAKESFKKWRLLYSKQLRSVSLDIFVKRYRQIGRVPSLALLFESITGCSNLATSQTPGSKLEMLVLQLATVKFGKPFSQIQCSVIGTVREMNEMERIGEEKCLMSHLYSFHGQIKRQSWSMILLFAKWDLL